MQNDNRPTHLDLFTGIGGFSFAFEAEGFRTVAFSEINEDKCLVLKEWWPHVPNLGALEGINGGELAAAHGGIDVITGGVPCQPASALGQMRGSADERWLWPQTIGVVRAVRPRFGVFENPPSILVLEDGRAWNGIVSELVALGYDCWWDVFPAAAFGAGHLRERILLVIADAGWKSQSSVLNGNRCEPGNIRERSFSGQVCYGSNTTGERSEAGIFQPRPRDQHQGICVGPDAPHADRAGLQGHAEHGADGQGRPGTGRPIAPPDLRGRISKGGCGVPWWHEAHTGIPVLADGLPARLVEAAARCAGDSVVPQVIQPIARAIYQSIKGKGGE